VCRIDPTVAERRVRERAGGDVERFARRLEPSFDVLQSVLECCGRALCREFGRGESCTLPDLPTRLASRPNDGGVAMTGALPIASTASEILLLEYGDGRPLDDVGWGRVTPDTLRETLRLHTAHYELTQRTPYLARKMGSALLATVSAAVTGRAEPGTQAPDPAVRDAKFVAYVGHDTNIWNIAGMLDVSWEQPGYQRNQTPPAGALVFEVRRWSDGKLRVQTSYVAQSLAQMRAGAPLTVERPPLRAALRIPGCSGAAPGHACTLDEFALAVRRVLDRNCVQ
jgi:4-phytase/acid phosphatase